VKVTDIPITAWRKSRRSNGTAECVEVATWRKSSRSNVDGNCVEVAARLEVAHVSVRDSKDPGGAVLTVSPADWRGFMRRIKAGLTPAM
jgi:Domain of unknown function (DUF397)